MARPSAAVRRRTDSSLKWSHWSVARRYGEITAFTEAWSTESRYKLSRRGPSHRRPPCLLYTMAVHSQCDFFLQCDFFFISEVALLWKKDYLRKTTCDWFCSYDADLLTAVCISSCKSCVTARHNKWILCVKNDTDFVARYNFDIHQLILITVGTDDVSHKPSSRLPLLSAKPTVTFPTLQYLCFWQHQFLQLNEEKHVSRTFLFLLCDCGMSWDWACKQGITIPMPCLSRHHAKMTTDRTKAKQCTVTSMYTYAQNAYGFANQSLPALKFLFWLQRYINCIATYLLIL